MKELESLKQIFKDRIFKIPDYQRGYAWSTKQVKDFWEDLVNLPSDRFHYTGLLSLKEVSRDDWKSWNEEGWLIEDRGFKPFHIVDGQQRLTTFVIFIQGIVDLVKGLPENQNKKDEEIYIGTFSLKQIKEEYLVIQKPPQFIINTYKFGYETDNPSFKYLRHRIFGEPNSGSIKETFYTLNLENAKRFFKENLQNYFDKFGISEIETLFKKTTQNLMFNIHEIQDDFDVFVAFETMNNRGKRLSNLELLKNRLIYLTTLYEEDELKNDERKSLRGKINDAWKEVYYQLGRNKQKPLSDDDFLTAHWIMYFQYTRQKGDDYIRFLLDEKFTPQNIFNKTEVKASTVFAVEEVRDEQVVDDQDELEVDSIVKISKLSPKEIEDYVGSLKSAAVHWYDTFNPLNNNELTRDEAMWLDRLNRIGIAYFRPLVTVSFISPEVNSAQRIKLFKEIERFIFIAFRLGRAFSTYRNNEYYKTTRLLRNGEISVDEICEMLRERVEEWLKPESGFDYQPFKTYIQRLYKNGNGFYDWNGLRYFLYEYESEKVHQFGNQKIDWNYFVKSEKDKVSIEHIYPQTPSKEYWKNAFKEFTLEEKRTLAGSLGNLLPLSSSINSSLQNDSFPDKKSAKMNAQGHKLRRGYSEGSHSEIEVSTYTDWNAENILGRGLKLLEFMEGRWDIKFEDEEHKKNLLFLSFVGNEQFSGH
ncbi:DUF262 domain-containing protein [Bacillus sp. es.034]|uniref:DUF262 domain-containing protein n=1 Tax=Bacillus sp. es.034 TaxID=1761763 RepID=UPI000BF7BB56|nr:DUF262 domain-containing protein [Bacillus sp. es.034]PFG07780.1 uncharacterized protein DUF1524 [Bacillus sp. es.034]